MKKIIKKLIPKFLVTFLAMVGTLSYATADLAKGDGDFSTEKVVIEIQENLYKAITGTVTDKDGSPIFGATVFIKGTTRGTVTGLNGTFSLEANEGDILVVSFLGFSSTEATIDAASDYTIELSEGVQLEEVVLIGTRASNRTNVSSAVPVDVINVSRLSLAAPQTTMNQLLHNTTPSFSSNTQTISDGTDHIDPASLRGLGPDQVLVLVNKKGCIPVFRFPSRALTLKGNPRSI